MRIKPNIGSIVGETDPSHWGQVFMLPQAYGVIEVVAGFGKAREFGIGLLSQLTERLSVVSGSLSDLVALVDPINTDIVQTLIILVPHEQHITIVLRGQGAVYIKRGTQVSALIEQSGEIAGDVQVGDMLLLVSSQLLAVCPVDRLIAALDAQDTQQITDSLMVLLQSHPGTFGGAGLTFQVVQIVDDRKEYGQSSVDESTMLAIPSEEHDVPKKLHPFSHALPGRFLHHVRHPKKIVEHVKERPRLVKALVATVLGILFVVSVGLGVYKQMTDRSLRAVRTALVQSQGKLDEGVSLLSLNPIKSREALQEAQKLIAPFASATSPRSQEGRKLVKLQEQIEDNLTQAWQIVHVEPSVFYDVTLLKSNAQASFFTKHDEAVVIVDRQTDGVYRVEVPTKRAEVVAGGSGYDGAFVGAAHGGNVYTLTSHGIHMVRLSDKKTTPQIIKKSDEWGTIVSLVSYGGNLYLSDVVKSRIWKYVAVDTPTGGGNQGFSEMREYLNPDTLPDLSQTTGMVIDGSVWMGTTVGKILKFTQGKEESFHGEGIDPPLGKQLVVYTDDETSRLYVLDTEGKRVVVLDKQGMYVAQYVWKGELSPVQLVVYENLHKILLLAEGKIYSVDMK